MYSVKTFILERAQDLGSQGVGHFAWLGLKRWNPVRFCQLQGPLFGLAALAALWRAVLGFDSLVAMALLHALVILSGLVSRCLSGEIPSPTCGLPYAVWIWAWGLFAASRAQFICNISDPCALTAKCPAWTIDNIPRTHKHFPKIWLALKNSGRRFRSQTSHFWTDAATVLRGAGQEKEPEEKSQEKQDQRTEDQSAWKGRKLRSTVFFPMFCGSRGSKSRLPKPGGPELSGEMRNRKLHAAVARSRFRSQRAKNTSLPMLFCQLRCWKRARRCGAKHVSKSNLQSASVPEQFCQLGCTTHARVCAQANFQVKMLNTIQCRAACGELRCSKSARGCGAKHVSKSKFTKRFSSRAVLAVEMHSKCTCSGAKQISKWKC